ncbi:hypothetical protein [Paraclostridium sordellii]|uniref:hypothetical protein n=1 Tax=Paraclostridium sordellii TaxID=1505 RepID=UPI00189BB630|nr:hypothetical protein [Paeniclostridium sordellii]MCR1850183.1 hypothetical protein [Paeniclostridium sordellii]
MFKNIKNFNILTFNGGGIRGSISIYLLNKIQEYYPSILGRMSPVGGTSTGSFSIWIKTKRNIKYLYWR